MPDSPTNSGGGEGDVEYLGCFHDNKANRVLGSKLSSPDMTTAVCLDYCTELEAAFMATQFGFECWCSPDGGLDYNRHYDITGEDALCDTDCMGDETEICGGFDSFNLYKLTPTSTCSGTPVEVYGQCGGTDWAGSTCCSEGTVCTDMVASGCYAQCRPVSVDDATPPPVATEEPTPVTPEPVAPTPEPATPAPVAPPAADPTPEPTEDDCVVVIIEAEDLATTGAWKVVKDSDASGGEYIVWEGLSESQHTRSPDDGDIISAVIDITSPGTYSFKWLMRQPSGVDGDKANDSWLYFPDAARFGPEGSNANYGTFVKVFGRANDGNFQYSGTAEEANHAKSQIAVEFAQPGRYTMEIAGRSHGHEIDQIILFGDTLSVKAAAAGCA